MTDQPDDFLQPLCPALYRRLRQLFHFVVIANQGEGLVGRQRRRLTRRGKRPVFDVDDPGEYYRVNCPFCTDTRQRLWINHMFGQPTPGQPDRTLNWLAVCYNDGCLESHTRRIQLEDRLFGPINRNERTKKFRVQEGDTETATLREVKMPGHVVRIDELPEHHVARRYIEERGFSSQVVGEDFGVTFCDDADPMYPAVAGRLVIPIYMYDELVGWQARVPDDNIDWKATGIPKYYGMRGMPKRLMLYNYDFAKALDFCVVVEGVTDVWAVGDPAVGLLGKKIHPLQRKLLMEFEGGMILMLDPDAKAETEGVVDTLLHKLEGRLAVVELEEGRDPAVFDEDVIWEIIADAARPAGIDISDAWGA